MTIALLVFAALIVVLLIYAATKPSEFRVQRTARFTLVPDGSATDVTWSTEGPSPYFTKLMGVFMNMDHMIGKDFESGLANLKSIAER